MKNILVPTDFSEISKNALAFAIKIAKPTKSKITLFYSNPPILIANDMGTFVYPDAGMSEEVIIEINKKMDSLVELVTLENIQCSKIVHKGILENEISNIVKEEKITLIVTGTHGAKGIDSFFFGTRSISMFEEVPCPVLIIPAKAKFTGIKKILYATDFQFGDIDEINKISELAALFDANIIITHINTDASKFDMDEESMDWFSEIGGNRIPYEKISYRLIHKQDVLEGLAEAIVDLDIDMVCMSTVEKGFFKKILSKSNTKEMAYHTSVPLMAIHLTRENKLV